MNETFAQVLKFVIVFWLIMTLFAVTFANRIGNYYISGDIDDALKIDHPTTNAIEIFFDIVSFNVTVGVPLWLSIIYDIITILTIISVLALIFNR